MRALLGASRRASGDAAGGDRPAGRPSGGSRGADPRRRARRRPEGRAPPAPLARAVSLAGQLGDAAADGDGRGVPRHDRDERAAPARQVVARAGERRDDRHRGGDAPLRRRRPLSSPPRSRRAAPPRRPTSPRVPSGPRSPARLLRPPRGPSRRDSRSRLAGRPADMRRPREERASREGRGRDRPVALNAAGSRRGWRRHGRARAPCPARGCVPDLGRRGRARRGPSFAAASDGRARRLRDARRPRAPARRSRTTSSGRLAPRRDAARDRASVSLGPRFDDVASRVAGHARRAGTRSTRGRSATRAWGTSVARARGCGTLLGVPSYSDRARASSIASTRSSTAEGPRPPPMRRRRLRRRHPHPRPDHAARRRRRTALDPPEAPMSPRDDEALVDAWCELDRAAAVLEADREIVDASRPAARRHRRLRPRRRLGRGDLRRVCLAGPPHRAARRVVDPGISDSRPRGRRPLRPAGPWLAPGTGRRRRGLHPRVARASAARRR